MKKIIILALIIVIVFCFYSIRNIYENFDYKKISLTKIENENNKTKIENENNNKNLIVLLNTIKNNLDYHNDRINKMDFKLDQIYE